MSRPTLSLVPPLRIDFDVRALASAARALLVSDEQEARAQAERVAPDALAFLSVRSALCAYLEAQLQSGRWHRGDEVLVSALTITDMPRILEAYGMRVVPLDVDPQTLAPRIADVRRHITPRTRALLVAHLFGARAELEPFARLCRERGLALLEDCAQAFAGPGWWGHPAAELSMFSFGTLKTRTSLGGALVIVRDAELRARMTQVQARWPAQARGAFTKKVAKSALFLLAQHPVVYGALALLVAAAGKALGDVLRMATRGFPAKDTAELLSLLRLRPCAPLLRFLARRVSAPSSRRADARLTARAALGERALEAARALGVAIGAAAHNRTHWAFAVRASDPQRLRAALAEAGVDASGASNISAVGGIHAPPALRALVEELVFLPVYPEVAAARRRAIEAVLARELARPTPELRAPLAA
ncbi:MAG: DegT/DnrJ/EryC1/StrS family aminotransferase [Deltaproteobacteria bacterium]|nr:DegT/DnrJ/EryC1/StrS family aminotransferase [Deltaproteobacteria bacterium]